jgi:hypothetical protein
MAEPAGHPADPTHGGESFDYGPPTTGAPVPNGYVLPSTRIPDLSGLYVRYVQLAKSPDALITGSLTRDANGAVTSAPVTWPDGSPGTFTADTVSSAFPGAVDAYHITYGSPVTKTYTQPAITRDSTGAATNVPAIVVS